MVYFSATMASLLRVFVLPALIALSPAIAVASPPEPLSRIRHLIVIVQENHTFDSYFGRYCRARTGAAPTCTDGPGCCEAGPEREPATGAQPVTLDDAENTDYDPNHSRGCELEEMHEGRMDRFVSGASCSNPRNFAYATQASASVYWDLASHGALADRYFQPVAGASSSNDMYLARAQYVFTDNQVEPASAGSACGYSPNPNRKTYSDPTIGDLLSDHGVSWAFYAEGYADALAAVSRGSCPAADPACPAGVQDYPCIYDPSDNPFEYYRSSLDTPATMKDLAELDIALTAGTLPSVSFVKGLGYKTEHPGSSISAGMSFVSQLTRRVAASPYAADTLVLVTFDESGGFYDHVAPPAASAADGQPYGPRVPLIATGRFARAGAISHVTLEHSSIVRFIEWNWLGGVMGQLRGRDAIVNGIGSLLDPAKTGVQVP
jgi:phospholipase C